MSPAVWGSVQRGDGGRVRAVSREVWGSVRGAPGPRLLCPGLGFKGSIRPFSAENSGSESPEEFWRHSWTRTGTKDLIFISFFFFWLIEGFFFFSSKKPRKIRQIISQFLHFDLLLSPPTHLHLSLLLLLSLHHGSGGPVLLALLPAGPTGSPWRSDLVPPRQPGLRAGESRRLSSR